MPPSFADQTYWQDRFSEDKEPFDWLLPASADLLNRSIRECLSTCEDEKPEILHIGCGTSQLSLHLRDFVKHPWQVQNTDFSSVAIEIASGWEQELVSEQRSKPYNTGSESEVNEESKDGPNCEKGVMRWSTLDLLSPLSMRNLLAQRQSLCNLVVDKSTCDAIACGDDLEVSLPYHFRIPDLPANTKGFPKARVHPLNILAIHLAAVTKVGARWLALSYSENRFPFLSPFPKTKAEGLLDKSVLDAGLPDPSQLWALDRIEEVEVSRPKTPTGAEESNTDGYDLKPKVWYWLYILVRTSVGLNVS